MIRSIATCLVLPALATAIPERALQGAAETYVKLVLAVGRHDASFVDAYYGPQGWKRAAEAGPPVPLPQLRARTGALGALLAQHAVLFGGEFLLPLGGGLGEFVGHGVG